MARENLNLIVIPVKSASEAALALVPAPRTSPTLPRPRCCRRLYDFDQAALLMASVCRPDRGTAVMKVCGSAAPDGPLLVTAQRPLDGAVAPGQRLLIVNLSTTSPEAIGEVLAAYRRQILRADFADRAEMDGWRLSSVELCARRGALASWAQQGLCGQRSAVTSARRRVIDTSFNKTARRALKLADPS